jgi:hypothetical protein
MSTENNQLIAKKIAEIMQSRGFRKDTELAIWLGCSKQTIQNWRKRNSIGDYSLFTSQGISEDWLRTGTGPMFTFKKAPAVNTVESDVLDANPHIVSEGSAAPLIPDPDRMPLEQKLAWIGFKTKDIRLIQEWKKLTDSEQEELLKKICCENIKNNRF